MLITMYAKGDGAFTAEFAEYVKQRQYHLKSLKEFTDVRLSICGLFHEIIAIAVLLARRLVIFRLRWQGD